MWIDCGRKARGWFKELVFDSLFEGHKMVKYLLGGERLKRCLISKGMSFFIFKHNGDFNIYDTTPIPYHTYTVIFILTSSIHSTVNVPQPSPSPPHH